jgi:hypothetical protein
MLIYLSGLVRGSYGASIAQIKAEKQILRLRLALNHPSDEDLSLGTRGNVPNTAQDDKSNYAANIGLRH